MANDLCPDGNSDGRGPAPIRRATNRRHPHRSWPRPIGATPVLSCGRKDFP